MCGATRWVVSLGLCVDQPFQVWWLKYTCVAVSCPFREKDDLESLMGVAQSRPQGQTAARWGCAREDSFFLSARENAAERCKRIGQVPNRVTGCRRECDRGTPAAGRC